MITFLLVLQIILTLIITIAVLLQKSTSIGLGAYSGSNESLFGAKGPAGFLAKFTAAVAIIFVINCITLGSMYQKSSNSSVLDNYTIEDVFPTAPLENNNATKN
ncbi:MAG: preprotein translocase subunit SecG [Campylobacter sp.]|nr:preprotein translocase subunit SecG [Campylobacter sp.]